MAGLATETSAKRCALSSTMARLMNTLTSEDVTPRATLRTLLCACAAASPPTIATAIIAAAQVLIIVRAYIAHIPQSATQRRTSGVRLAANGENSSKNCRLGDVLKPFPSTMGESVQFPVRKTSVPLRVQICFFGGGGVMVSSRLMMSLRSTDGISSAVSTSSI